MFKTILISDENVYLQMKILRSIVTDNVCVYTTPIREELYSKWLFQSKIGSEPTVIEDFINENKDVTLIIDTMEDKINIEKWFVIRKDISVILVVYKPEEISNKIRCNVNYVIVQPKCSEELINWTRRKLFLQNWTDIELTLEKKPLLIDHTVDSSDFNECVKYIQF
jgi:hypothetical protein